MPLRAKFDISTIPQKPNLEFETPLWEGGFRWVAGIDEAGRGALAGPVSVGIVILPEIPDIADELAGVRDSKQMDPKNREFWRTRIQQISIAYSVGFANNDEIDRMGIVRAVELAVKRGLMDLTHKPEHLLVDYFSIPEILIPQTALIKGDARSLSIAAASILAKTHRDEQMRCFDGIYPAYGFARHKGYGTAAHREAIQIHGLSSLHRKSYHLHKC